MFQPQNPGQPGPMLRGPDYEDDPDRPECEDDPDCPDYEASPDIGTRVTSSGLIEQHFVVEPECHGFRLDRFLQKKIRRLSRARIQRVISGDCQVQGRKAHKSMRVFFGQHVVFRRPAPIEPQVPKDVRLVFADPDFYLLDKPAGLPIHPTARYHLSTLTAVLRERFPGEVLQACHRLDRETSGLILLARHPQAASVLKTAFARRTVHKRYLALVHGRLPLGDGETLLVDAPLGPAASTVRIKMAVRTMAEGGVCARTAVQVVRRFEQHTLVQCRPHTGRQHQIRVHLAHLGFPIVGDKLYPDETIFLKWAQGGDEAVSGLLPLPRHALHAAGLAFLHPRTGAPVQFELALAEDLERFVGGLGCWKTCGF